MAIDPRYIPAFSIEDVILDKDTGAPLSGGLVYFEQDNQRGVLKPVYQITGTSPDYSYIQLPNPMTLSSIGTFEDSLGNPVVPYFFPYDAEFDIELYYVRVTSSEDVPQFDREAVPYVPFQGNDEIINIITNELSNPQFVEISFDTSNGPYTFNVDTVVDEVINIAPDWDFIVSSPAAGTLTVNQLKPAGTLNIITNPGTILNITSGGLTKLQLRQRIYGSPNLWGSGYLSATFVAKTYGGVDIVLNMFYSQSNGTVVDQLLVAALLDASGNYGSFPGTAFIPSSTSTDDFPNAYIDIYFNIPLSTEIDITSIMVASTGSVSIPKIAYDQESEARQIDHLFHYYQNALIIKPKQSILTAWNFSLNPFQFYSNGQTTAATQTQYVADQTILHQRGGGSTVFTEASDVAIRDCFVVGAINGMAENRFAIIQYIDPTTIRPYWDYVLSSLARTRIFTSHGTEIGIKMRLIWSTILPNTLAPTEPILSWTGVDPVFNSNWAVLLPKNDPTYILPNSYITSEGPNAFPYFPFDGFEMPSMSTNTMTLGIVLYTTENMNDSLGSTDAIGFDKISLVPNEFAVDSPPQTFDDVLRQCQFYYEKSYDNFTLPGTVNSLNSSLIAQQIVGLAGGSNNVIPNSFGSAYSSVKRKNTPLLNIYSPITGSASNVYVQLYNGGTPVGAGADAAIANWTEISAGSKAFSFVPATSTPIYAPGLGAGTTAAIFYHYTIDARLGLVS